MAGTLKLGATGGQILFSTSGTSGFSTPSTGYGSLYYGDDKQLRLKNDQGVITILSSGGVAGTNGTSGTSPGGGSSGTSGVDGTSGTSGTQGQQGPGGTSGTSGTQGTSGTAGNSGTSGSAGTSGQSGTSGIGAKGITGSNLAISFDDSALFNIDTSISSTAVNNIAIGTDSMYALVNGYNNIAVGNETLLQNEGNNNIAIGTETFKFIENSDNNIGIGLRAGLSFNTSESNIAIGNNSLALRAGQVDNSSYNIAIGNNALGYLWEYSDNNVAIGDGALISLSEIGISASGSTGNNNNVAIGYAAGASITGGANNLILGPTGGTGGMTGTIVLTNGNNTTEIVINSSALQSGSYTSNRRIPIKIGGSTYYLMLST